MISLTNYDFQWALSELDIIYPDIRVLHGDTDFRWLVWEPVLYRSASAPKTVDGLCHNWSPNPNPSTGHVWGPNGRITLW